MRDYMIDYGIILLIVFLLVSIIGYVFSVLREKMDLFNNRVVIKSKNVSQHILDKIDLKIFKLGNIKLTIGDEIRIYLKNNKFVQGTLIGAKKKDNCLCLVTKEDELVELNIKTIRKLKVMTRYGRLF